jgi:glutamine amidotransferase
VNLQVKKPKIALIDYGMGNLRSVGKALELAGADVCVTNSARQINSAYALVLPGVGSFGPAIKNLKKEKLVETIIKSVNSGKQYLGLCLGFQFLFDSSEEEGNYKGLGLIEGKVKKFVFKGSNRKLKIPHMGWNNVSSCGNPGTMFKGIKDGSYFYFVHSYYGVPKDNKAVAGTTDYGFEFCSAVEKDNIWACQFHPEKSGETGIKLLKNFVGAVKKD